MDMKWYVVYTKPTSEKKVSEILTRRKIENYIPVCNTSEKWSDSRKVKEKPLFKNYVFVKTHEQNHDELKKINGVVNLVYWMGKPVCIKHVEIKAIRLFLDKYENVHIEKTPIRPHLLCATDIPEAEQEAAMITLKNNRANIILPSLGYVMSAEVGTAVRIISSQSVINGENLKFNKLFNKVSEFNNSLKNYWAKS